jgi:hypothetical protein
MEDREMTTTRMTELTMASGKKVQVQVTVTRNVIHSERVWADGNEMECKCYRLQQYQEIVASMDGVEVDRAYMGNIRYVRSKQPGIIAVINNRIGLTQERIDQINAAIKEATAEAESDPEVVEYRAAEARAQKVNNEYEEHRLNVENMMTLDGHTY